MTGRDVRIFDRVRAPALMLRQPSTPISTRQDQDTRACPSQRNDLLTHPICPVSHGSPCVMVRSHRYFDTCTGPVLVSRDLTHQSGTVASLSSTLTILMAESSKPASCQLNVRGRFLAAAFLARNISRITSFPRHHPQESKPIRPESIRACSFRSLGPLRFASIR